MTLTTASLVAAAAVVATAAVAGPIVRALLRRRGRHAIAKDLEALAWPVRALLAAVALRILFGPVDGGERLAPLAALALTAAIAWVLVRSLWVLQQALLRRLSIDAADNLRARSRRTQIELLRRVASVVVVVGAGLVVLFTVTPLGRVGSTFVAYAGLVGVVLGVALRSPLENLAAGIVVAVSEPIRIDDVVVVEEQWGRIEQIGLTNVVVRLWDDRRLVLPTSRFVTGAFENWTRRSASLYGSVTMWVDYGTDVQRLRREIEGIVERSPHWDGRECVVQVIELGERAMQVRALVTARDAPAAWQLRCEVRERVHAYLHDHRDWLPVVRVDDLDLDGSGRRSATGRIVPAGLSGAGGR